MAPDYSRIEQHAVSEIAAYRKYFDLEEDWRGILIDPYLDEEREVVQVYVNVRTIDGPDATMPGERAGYRYGLEYTFDGLQVAEILEEVYPAMIEEIETAFAEARVQYPDIYDV